MLWPYVMKLNVFTCNTEIVLVTIKKNMNLALNEYPYTSYIVGIQHYLKYTAGDQ
jgi:hypothetical protein